MAQTNVWIKEKGYEIPVDELTPYCFRELVNRRVFETIKDMQLTLLALERGASRYALEHGHACPADTKRAIDKIKALPTY